MMHQDDCRYAGAMLPNAVYPGCHCRPSPITAAPIGQTVVLPPLSDGREVTIRNAGTDPVQVFASGGSVYLGPAVTGRWKASDLAVKPPAGYVPWGDCELVENMVQTHAAEFLRKRYRLAHLDMVDKMDASLAAEPDTEANTGFSEEDFLQRYELRARERGRLEDELVGLNPPAKKEVDSPPVDGRKLSPFPAKALGSWDRGFSW